MAFPDQIRRIVRRASDRLRVIEGNRYFTFGEVDRRSSGLAVDAWLVAGLTSVDIVYRRPGDAVRYGPLEKHNALSLPWPAPQRKSPRGHRSSARYDILGNLLDAHC